MNTKPLPSARLLAEASTGEPTPEWEAVLDRVQRAMANAEFVKIDPKRLRPMKGQPREFFDESELTELSRSIVRVGQFQPGIIRRNVPKVKGTDREILDGERRWRSVILGNVAIYKAMELVIDDEAAPFVIASIANFNRAGHTHMEISNAINRLHAGLKMPVPVVAKMYNITPFWAYELMGLQKLHPSIRKLLDPHLTQDKRLPITAAMQVSKLDQSVQSELVSHYLSGVTTLKGLRREALAIAERSGTYIRKQTESNQPARKLHSADRLSGALLRTAIDLDAALRVDGMSHILHANLPVAHRIGVALEKTENMIGLSLSAIARAKAGSFGPSKPPALPDPKATAPKPDVKATAARFADHHNVHSDNGTGAKAPAPKPTPVAKPKTATVTNGSMRCAPTHPAVKPVLHRPAPIRFDQPVEQEKIPDDLLPWKNGITVTYLDDSIGRPVTNKLNAYQYLTLFNKGYLKFQSDKKPKPNFLPTREQAERLMKLHL